MPQCNKFMFPHHAALRKSLMKYRFIMVSLMLTAGSGVVNGGNVELAGELPREIRADKSPYIVKADIFVPSGKTVKIEPGVVLRFNNFTGLNVQGILTAKGTVLRPIVFTSSNDRVYSNDTLTPTPYDWNGIYIQKDGMGTVLENFKVMYSVKGLVSETKFINIIGGSFSENGRSHCTIEGAEQSVTAGAPFTFTVSLKDATIDGVPVNILRDPQAVKRNTFRYSGLTVMFGSLAMGSALGARLYDSQKLFEARSSRDTSNILHYSSADWATARVNRNRDVASTAAAMVVAVVGATGFFWTFTF
jgi:hypothetical protein